MRQRVEGALWVPVAASASSGARPLAPGGRQRNKTPRRLFFFLQFGKPAGVCQARRVYSNRIKARGTSRGTTRNDKLFAERVRDSDHETLEPSDARRDVTTAQRNKTPLQYVTQTCLYFIYMCAFDDLLICARSVRVAVFIGGPLIHWQQIMNYSSRSPSTRR